MKLSSSNKKQHLLFQDWKMSSQPQIAINYLANILTSWWYSPWNVLLSHFPRSVVLFALLRSCVQKAFTLCSPFVQRLFFFRSENIIFRLIIIYLHVVHLLFFHLCLFNFHFHVVCSINFGGSETLTLISLGPSSDHEISVIALRF